MSNKAMDKDYLLRQLRSFEGDVLAQKSIASEEGYHNFRYYNGALSYKDGNTWEDINLGNTDYVELTQAEYNALSSAEKNNGKMYFITDAEGGGGGSDITFTLYSATQDTVTISQNGTTVETVTIESGNSADVTLPKGRYTFTSSIAKNPDDLSAFYSKEFDITPAVIDVYLMPDNVLYWYGYHEDTMTAYAYYYNGTTGKAPTLTMNTNSFKVTGTQYGDANQGIVAFGQKYNLSNYDSIVTHVVSSGQYNNYLMSADELKNAFTSAFQTGLSAGVKTTDISNISSNSYIVVSSIGNRETTIDFIYFKSESTDISDKANKTDIAPVENGTTASRVYAIGQQFYLSDGKLYRCKQPIAQGATFTIGTNCELAPNITDCLGKKVELWTNPNIVISTSYNPNVTFAAQSLDAVTNLMDYDYFAIDVLLHTFRNYMNTVIIPNDVYSATVNWVMVNIISPSPSGNFLARRNIAFDGSTHKLTFSSGMYLPSYGGASTTDDNHFIVPYKIYGIKL